MGSGWGVKKSRHAMESYAPAPTGVGDVVNSEGGKEASSKGSGIGCHQIEVRSVASSVLNSAPPPASGDSEKVWCAGVQTEKRNGKFWWADDSGAATASGDHFRGWSVQQVVEWVQTVQGGRFSGHAEKFRARGVDGKALPALTQLALKDMGVQDPKTRGILLSAISTEASFASSVGGHLAVKPQEELARLASQKEREAKEREQREASPSPDEDEEGRADAAAMMLRGILGKEGCPDDFIEIIRDWRNKNPLKEHSSDNVAGGDAADIAQHAGAAGDRRVLVAARVRPLLANGPDEEAVAVGDFESVSVPASSSSSSSAGGGALVVHSCGMRIDGKTPKVDHKVFRTHSALAQSCEERHVFEMAAPLVRAAVESPCHVTVLCYGQTGSGKTHTVGHLAGRIAGHLYGALGVEAVALEAFELQGGAKGILQLGAGHAFSLSEDSRPELALFEGTDGIVHVGGSTGIVSESGKELDPERCNISWTADELQRLFKAAERRRLSVDTHRNKASSRTHAFYRFHVAAPSAALGASEGSVMSTGACIELVDLAGSESNKDSLYHDKSRVDASAKINSSLMALNDCIRKTAQGAKYVPFRSDKLTQLLRPCFVKRKEALSGVATVLFLACVSPLASDVHHSVRTLTYMQQLTGLPTGTGGKTRPVGKGKAKPKARPAREPWQDPVILEPGEDSGTSPVGKRSEGGLGPASTHDTAAAAAGS